DRLLRGVECGQHTQRGAQPPAWDRLDGNQERAIRQPGEVPRHVGGVQQRPRLLPHHRHRGHRAAAGGHHGGPAQRRALMASDDLCWLPALELAALIRSRKVSPVEVMEAVLARIERVNPALSGFGPLPADDARDNAQAAEVSVMTGEELGPLHGVPVSVKDLVFTRRVLTTGGSRLFADHMPEEDAVAVERLKGAGAIILGKTTTPEFGHKGVTDSPLCGITRNPGTSARARGGWSGGGAVAAAPGLGPLALGTDGGGSIRIPASFCGIYGLKPSFGRVPHGPGFPGWRDFSV